MAYQEFLEAFAAAQGVGSVEALLAQHSDQYAFQIKSRERAKAAIELLATRAEVNFAGKRVLDVGCAYGSYTIELIHKGALALGVDVNDKWLKLAEVNARDEANVKFLNCDASCHRARALLAEHGPFDIFVVNDVFEHIYDTAGLLHNLSRLSAPDAFIYFKIPNGLATRNVMSEGHKKIFGVSLLPPDYWHLFMTAPFHIYYRRWPYFEALFKQYGFSDIRSFNAVGDPDIEKTRRNVVHDVNKVRQHLKVGNFASAQQFRFLQQACRYYYEEVAYDLETMDLEPLFHKYRETFWHGVARRSSNKNSL